MRRTTRFPRSRALRDTPAAMSEESATPALVELVRQVIDAFNSGDIERVVGLIHRDFEASVPPQFSAEPDIYRGHQGIRRYFDSFNDAMSEIHFEQGAFTEVGDAVVVAVRLTAKGRSTGIVVEQQLAQVFTARDGKLLQIRSYGSLPEALQSVDAAQ
jgi:ketosteroid isomerase-like protein